MAQIGLEEEEEEPEPEPEVVVLSDDQVRQMAAEEGVVLLPSKASSGFKGVTKHGNRWRASVSVGGNVTQLGPFGSAMEAALAYARHLGPAWFVVKAERAAAKEAAAEAKRMEKQRREDAAKEAATKKQRVSKEEAAARKEQVAARKEEARAAKQEANARAKAERAAQLAALQELLQEREAQQAAHQSLTPSSLAPYYQRSIPCVLVESRAAGLDSGLPRKKGAR